MIAPENMTAEFLTFNAEEMNTLQRLLKLSPLNGEMSDDDFDQYTTLARMSEHKWLDGLDADNIEGTPETGYFCNGGCEIGCAPKWVTKVRLINDTENEPNASTVLCPFCIYCAYHSEKHADCIAMTCFAPETDMNSEVEDEEPEKYVAKLFRTASGKWVAVRNPDSAVALAKMKSIGIAIPSASNPITTELITSKETMQTIEQVENVVAPVAPVAVSVPVQGDFPTLVVSLNETMMKMIVSATTKHVLAALMPKFGLQEADVTINEALILQKLMATDLFGKKKRAKKERDPNAPKKVLTEEQKQKMKEGRERKKAAKLAAAAGAVPVVEQVPAPVAEPVVVQVPAPVAEPVVVQVPAPVAETAPAPVVEQEKDKKEKKKRVLSEEQKQKMKEGKERKKAEKGIATP